MDPLPVASAVSGENPLSFRWFSPTVKMTVCGVFSHCFQNIFFVLGFHKFDYDVCCAFPSASPTQDLLSFLKLQFSLLTNVEGSSPHFCERRSRPPSPMSPDVLTRTRSRCSCPAGPRGSVHFLPCVPCCFSCRVIWLLPRPVGLLLPVSSGYCVFSV